MKPLPSSKGVMLGSLLMYMFVKEADKSGYGSLPRKKE